MTKLDDQTGSMITSSRDAFERLLAAWKLFELERAEPMCVHEVIEHAARRTEAR